MELSKLQDLFQDPDVRAAITEHVNSALKETRESLEEAKSDLDKQVAAGKKRMFILEKSVLAKASLYEQKLREYYEARFTEAKKSLAKETQLFIEEAVKQIQTSVEEELRANGQAAKLTEAFATALRTVAPFVNVDSLQEDASKKVEELTATVNKLMKERSELLQKAFVADVHELVVTECVGYPLDKQAVIYKAVTKLAPASLTEAKTLIAEAKESLREQEAEALKLTENVAPVIPAAQKPEAPERGALKKLVESAAKTPESAPKHTSLSAKNLGYEIVFS